MIFEPNKGNNFVMRLSKYMIWGSDPSSGTQTSISIYNNSDKDIIIRTYGINGVRKIVYPLTICQINRMEEDERLDITFDGITKTFHRSDFKRKMNEYKSTRKNTELLREIDAKKIWCEEISRKSDVFYYDGDIIWERKSDEDISGNYLLLFRIIVLVLSASILILLILLNIKIYNYDDSANL